MTLMNRVRTQLGVPGEKKAAPDAAAGAETIEISSVPQGKQNWLTRRAEMKKLQGKFESYPHLLALKPREKYVFRSDYFEVDNGVACILAFFHDDAAQEGFTPFWGIDRIPTNLDDRVTAVVLEQIVVKDKRWTDQYTKQSEQLGKLENNEGEQSGSTSAKRKAQKVSSDLEVAIAEMQNGASYLKVQNRLFLKAPDLTTLEESIDRVSRLYIDRFGTVSIAPYAGEQRQELSQLWRNNDKKRGKGFGFTSTELAGSYSLVTNGLNDRAGEYVGKMEGDVNNSAVLMNVNNYEHHVVIADNTVHPHLGRELISNAWCSKISQSAMLANAKVVHLVLDGADLDKLGPKFANLTSRVDLNNGDVNMFEMFGEYEDELAIFSSQMLKLTLMFEQMYETSDQSVGSIIRSQLEKTATQFYIDSNMWVRNAQHNRSKIRVVGIPHEQVPTLQLFSSYLETAHKTLVNSEKNDPEQLKAYSMLTGIAKNLLDNNGDLFNNTTVGSIDGVRDARRVVYDFSKLRVRGKGIAMAQLVNIVGFAVGKLSRGDVVIIHGAEGIDVRVKEYLERQFESLYTRGARVVYSYNDVDKMLEDSKFNKFDAADYTVFGAMRDKTVAEYQLQLAQKIPPDMVHLITARGVRMNYLRRGVTNVVFHVDLALGINPYREAQRRALEQAAQKAEEARALEALMEGAPIPGAHATSARPLPEIAVDDDKTGRAQARRVLRKNLVPPVDTAAPKAGIRKLVRR